MFSKQIQGNDVSQHLIQEFSFPHVFRYWASRFATAIYSVETRIPSYVSIWNPGSLRHHFKNSGETLWHMDS